MHSLPKSSAEILATAKRVPQKEIRPRKSKTQCIQPLKDRLSTMNFRKHTISDIPSAGGSSSSTPSKVNGLNNVHFKDPTTHETFQLEAALEIKDGRDIIVEEIPDIFGDELPTTRVSLIFFNICK